MRPRLTGFAGVALVLCMAMSPSPARALPTPDFGTSSATSVTYGPCDALGIDPSQPLDPLNCVLLVPRLPAPSSGHAAIPVHLPSGALISSIVVRYSDSDVNFDPSLTLYETGPLGAQSTIGLINLNGGSSGDMTQTFNVDPPHVVDNVNSYAFTLNVSNTATGVTGFRSISVNYKLQVSPAPGMATFGDVPTNHQFFQFVEALAASGITGGCGGGNYCPDNPVTRGQMAAFLAKALGLHFPN